jgi:hypothetical protein
MTSRLTAVIPENASSRAAAGVQIDHTPTRERASVISTHNYRTAVATIGYPDHGPEGEGAVGGCQPARPGNFAARRLAALVGINSRNTRIQWARPIAGGAVDES